VVGNVDSGKSTTLGVLPRGTSDDGRGRARVQPFWHKHEIETGRTSHVGMENIPFVRYRFGSSTQAQILGFSPTDQPILSALAAGPKSEIIKREKLEWDDFAARGSKIIRFIDSQLSYHFLFHLTLPTDLAGHEKYLKV
jgi:hypothetical protein